MSISRFSAGALLAATLASTTGVVATAAVPASAAAPTVASQTTTSTAYFGYSTGDVIYANAANLPPTDIAKASVAQSAAAVATNGALTTTDQLKQQLIYAATAGKTAYGHGAGVNVGLLQGQTAPPQVNITRAEATSPPPSSASGEAANIPVSPLLTADVLPAAASANTTSSGSCVTGKPLSEGTAHVANAAALITPSATVLTVGNAVSADSTTSLVNPVNASGAPVSSGNAALSTQTTEAIAPVTLFAGTPAQLTIKVLDPIRLAVEAGGVPGTSVVSYAPVGATSPTVPVLSVTSSGGTQTLTSEQLFGNGGLNFQLGVADVTVGTPPTGLDGTGSPQISADGTSTAAAADFIRVTIPASSSTPQQNPVSGPLAPVLNPVLNPVISGLSPILTQIQQGLASAGLDLADVRVGHFEATATAPAGGIVCSAGPNPFDESYKDVSAVTAAPGQTFDYTVRFPNRGTSAVTNAVVTDTFAAPAGAPPLQFVSSSPYTATQNGNTLTFQVGTIQPGQFVEITMVFRVPSNAANGTEYSNSAVISGTYGGQPITKTVSVTGPTVATGTGGCSVATSTKFATNVDVTHGENFGYVVNVYNSGGSPCTDVVVTDPLDSQVTFVSCTAGCTHQGQNVTWDLGTVAPGQSEALTVIVSVNSTASGTLPNTATITPANGTPASPSTPGPTVTTSSVGNAGTPAGAAPSGAAAGGNATRLAYTGSSPLLPITAAGLLGLAGMGLFLARRRRG